MHWRSFHSRPLPGRAVVLALVVLAVSIITGVPLHAETSFEQPFTASHLVVTDEHGERLVALAMPPGARWCVGWNHSVKGFPVHDCYRNVAGDMVLERSHQPDFAAGLGHIYGRGEQLSDGRGGYWIEHIDEPVPGNRYVLRVGSKEVDHRLLWQEDGTSRVHSLSAEAAGQRVTLQLIKPDNV
ncbi:DUF1850 domain-containing protein [Halomonas sp. Bachu 37]|uniref:DUF1850 domain-containing protein n=1 Tax=Halomonas kashgarensis TaxID=3084920 RepID=UPI003216B5CB